MPLPLNNLGGITDLKKHVNKPTKKWAMLPLQNWRNKKVDPSHSPKGL